MTVSDPEVVKYFYEQSGQYFFFEVVANDGHETAVSADARLYDDYDWWLDQARAYVTAWSTMMNNLITDTALAARGALLRLNTFLGGDMEAFALTASGGSGLFWVAIPAGATASGAGAVITQLAIDAYSSKSQDGYDAVVAEMDRLIELNRQQNRDQVAAITAQLNLAVNNLESELDNDPNLTPDAKALRAIQHMQNLREDYPLGKMAPSSDDIYGELLVKYGDDQGFSFFGSCYALEEWGNYWQASGIGGMPWIDVHDVVDALNALGYRKGERYYVNWD